MEFIRSIKDFYINWSSLYIIPNGINDALNQKPANFRVIFSHPKTNFISYLALCFTFIIQEPQTAKLSRVTLLWPHRSVYPQLKTGSETLHSPRATQSPLVEASWEFRTGWYMDRTPPFPSFFSRIWKTSRLLVAPSPVHRSTKYIQEQEPAKQEQGKNKCSLYPLTAKLYF